VAALNPPAPAADTNGSTHTPTTKEPVVDNKPVTVTDETFEAEVLAHTLPVVVDFWAPWCGPCRMVAPVLDKLAEEFAGKVRIAKVNTDENPGLSQAFQIMSIPTIMMVKERTIVFSQPGALPESALRDLFQQLVDLEIPEEHKYKPGQQAQEPEATDETAQ
jgi:thioredoxin 1